MKPWGDEGRRYVGKPVDRVDGVAKVTGAANYAGDFSGEGLLYGVVVSSKIAKGKIALLATEKARAVAGVVEILTHENRPHIAWFNSKHADDDAPPGWHFRALYDATIRYADQPIALVLAEGFEQARAAAALLEVTYQSEPSQTDLYAELAEAYEPKKTKLGFEKPSSRGNAEKAFAGAKHRIGAEYRTSMQHHNPLEMHASTVFYKEDGSFTVYDKTQGTMNSLTYVCNAFGLAQDKVRVLAAFVGGAFGSGLRPQYQLYLAMMAAIKLKRSVRVMLTRQQMFSFGYRPAATQQMKLGADDQGRLQSLEHGVTAQTSRFEDYTENVVNWTGNLYQCDNVALSHKLVQLDLYSPLDMRAPGAATGLFALESGMDELAVKMGMDPIALRLVNYAEKDQSHYHRSFSSKELRACYEYGAERFGWEKKSAAPRSMRAENKQIGWGVATGVWDAMQMKAAVKAELSVQGKLKVSSAVTDIGTGTYTIMAQMAAETLGLAIEDVVVELGDSSLSAAPLQGGSWTAASLGTATQVTCEALAEALFAHAQKVPNSPFAHLKFTEVRFAGGAIESMGPSPVAMALKEVLVRSQLTAVSQEGEADPKLFKQLPYARHTHSAIFAEVQVDEDLGSVEVTRVVAAVAAGRILNPKTARSQILGGVVWGIGMALHEESQLDVTLGRIMNSNFAEYQIPVNRDIPLIDVLFIPETDAIVNPIGVKGVGEIGVVGTAAAIANAIYHATGKRLRELPIRLENLL